MKTREPDDLGLFDVDPASVLRESPLEVSNPTSQLLLCLWGKLGPHWWQETVEEGVGQVIELGTHTDLSIKRLFEVSDGGVHVHDELVVSLKLLQQHDLGRRWNIKRLSDIVVVERLWQGLVRDVLGDCLDDLFLVNTTALGAI